MTKKNVKATKEVVEQNTLIICDNKYCRFIATEPTYYNKLKKFLSYKVPGVEYTAAYQNGWNGINYLIDKNGFFYSGLVNKVREFLRSEEIEFIESDRTIPATVNQEIDLTARLQELNMVPRDYQLDVLNVAVANRKGIIRAATGSGKTLATALITAKLNKPTIIYVIGLDLLQQFHDLFSKVFDEPIGFIGNGVCDIQRINIASIWTVARSLKVDKKALFVADSEEADNEEEMDASQHDKIVKMLAGTNVHLFDESHVASTETIKTIYKNINPEHIYGFSGTPFRDDNTDLLIHGVLGDKLIDISASLLIKRGVLAQPIIKFVPVPPLRTGNNYQAVYKEYVVENDFRNNLIVKETKGLLEKGYTPLVLFKQIKHGDILFELMQEEGIKCALLSGTDSLERRTEIKEQLNKKEIDVIIASVIFDIGLDLPILSGLVLAGSGKSLVKILQRCGRILRSYPGKKYAAVVDFYDQVRYLKQHSLKRCEVYESEEGFIIKKPKFM